MNKMLLISISMILYLSIGITMEKFLQIKTPAVYAFTFFVLGVIYEAVRNRI